MLSGSTCPPQAEHEGLVLGTAAGCSRPAAANAPRAARSCGSRSGNPIDRRDGYRMVARIAKVAGIPGHISPHSLSHAAITNVLDADVPLRDAQILARHADPRTTEHDDRARGNLNGDLVGLRGHRLHPLPRRPRTLRLA
jgi:hypothetical protein